MKAKIKWTLVFDYPITHYSSFELEQFYLEESHCQENLLNYLVSESEHGKCKLCSIGTVELLEVIEDEEDEENEEK